jgi:hypothetical protein
MSRFRPWKAESIGLILHYECTFRCAHCLYACRPGLREDVRPEDLERLLDSIALAVPEAALHLGGGEPFLHMDRLVRTLAGIRRRGLLLEYVETNGFWIRGGSARERLKRVREAGCSCLLLSISPFHNEFLSCQDNARAYRMIVDVFGPNGIFPWHPAHYAYLEQVDPERPVPFREYARRFPNRELLFQLTGINYLHLAGRAAWTLSPLLDRRPAETYSRKTCASELSSPVHAHVDPAGHYLTGFCSGIQIGDQEGFHLEALYQEGISLESHPLLEILVHGCLGDLLDYAERRGFRSDTAGYVSACHLCGHIRLWLYHHLPPDERPQELAPAFFYEELRAMDPTVSGHAVPGKYPPG